jgi:hypothetical protein
MVSKAAEYSGSVEIAWEARMTLAEIQRASGDAAGASKQMELLAARERSTGLLLLAKKTSAAQMKSESDRIQSQANR